MAETQCVVIVLPPIPVVISHIVSVDVKHHGRIREDPVCCDGALCPVGVLDVLHCVLIDSPEALNMIKEKHIITIISLIDKHGRDPKVCVLGGRLSLLDDLSWMRIIVVILTEHGDCEHLKKKFLSGPQVLEAVAQTHLLGCVFIAVLFVLEYHVCTKDA